MRTYSAAQGLSLLTVTARSFTSPLEANACSMASARASSTSLPMSVSKITCNGAAAKAGAGIATASRTARKSFIITVPLSILCLFQWNHTIQLQSVSVFTVKYRKVRDLIQTVGGERIEDVLVKVVPPYIPAGPVDHHFLVQILVTVSVIDRWDTNHQGKLVATCPQQQAVHAGAGIYDCLDGFRRAIELVLAMRQESKDL